MTQGYKKPTKINYFIFHWKQSRNITQGFIICYTGTLSCQCSGQNTLESSSVLSHPNPSAKPLLSTFRIYSKSDLLSPLLPDPYPFLQAWSKDLRVWKPGPAGIWRKRLRLRESKYKDPTWEACLVMIGKV